VASVGGTFTEGDTSALLFLSSALITDVDANHFDGGSLTVALGSYYAGDTLSVVAGNGISVSGSTVSYNGEAIGTVSGGSGSDLVISFISADADITAVQALVGQIGYSSSSENPTQAGSAGSRSVTVTLNDGGNTGTGGEKDDLTPVTGSFAVIGVNDAPAISGLDTTSLNLHVQGGAAVVLDANVVLSDVDLEALSGGTGNWDGSTLTLARDGGADADDVFEATGSLGSLSASSGNVVVSGTTIGTYSNASGTLTLTFNANATTALVNTALNSIAYRNAITTPGALAYDQVTLAVTINDQNSNATGGTAGSGQDQGTGGALFDTETIKININRLPVVVADTNNVFEGTDTGSTTNVTGNVLTDPTADSDPDTGVAPSRVTDTLTVAGVSAGSVAGPLNSNVGSPVTGSYGSVTVSSTGAYTYTVDNTKSAVQALAVGETLTDTFSYTVSDGRGGTTLTITIDGTNDAPVITGAIADFGFTEVADASAQDLSQTGTLSFDDIDTTDVIDVTSAVQTAAVWSGGTIDRSLV